MSKINYGTIIGRITKIDNVYSNSNGFTKINYTVETDHCVKYPDEYTKVSMPMVALLHNDSEEYVQFRNLKVGDYIESVFIIVNDKNVDGTVNKLNVMRMREVRVLTDDEQKAYELNHHINNGFAFGALTKKPEIVTANNGTRYVNFVLAVRIPYSKNEQGKADANFLSFRRFFNRPSEKFAKFIESLDKGCCVEVRYTAFPFQREEGAPTEISLTAHSIRLGRNEMSRSL